MMPSSQLSAVTEAKAIARSPIFVTPLLLRHKLHQPCDYPSNTAVMQGARSLHNATRLANGHVLVTGGVGPAGGGNTLELALASVEIYNPTTETWSLVASLTMRRMGHQATILEDGRLVVTGGAPVAVFETATVEIYTPPFIRGSLSSPLPRVAPFMRPCV